MPFPRMINALAVLLTVGVAAACDDVTGSDGDATILVQNDASLAVVDLFISPCEDETWGGDELGSGTIQPGAVEDFDVEPGCYDLRAEFTDQSFAQDFGIDLDEGDEFTWRLID